MTFPEGEGPVTEDEAKTSVKDLPPSEGPENPESHDLEDPELTQDEAASPQPSDANAHD